MPAMLLTIINTETLRNLAMSHVEENVEVVGITQSVLMVLGGLAVAILPAIVQIVLLAN